MCSENLIAPSLPPSILRGFDEESVEPLRQKFRQFESIAAALESEIALALKFAIASAPGFVIAAARSL